jgi:integrase
MKAIKPLNNNGSIQLKFSVAGRRYSFNPVPRGSYSDKRDLQTSQAIATRIQNDLLAGCFDPTLDRYRLAPKATKPSPKSLLELWDAWVSTLDISEQTRANHYNGVRQMLVKANPSLADATWLTKAPLAASSFNIRLSFLRACYRWALEQQLVTTSPYATIKPRKQQKQPAKPFTAAEVKAICDGFDRLQPHYSPFVRFLLATGCRTGEAVGLQWKHIDLAANTVVISEALVRDRTSGYRKLRKGTKTGSTRVLGLTLELRELLDTLKAPGVSPDALVFTTVNGCAIDASTFRARQWKPVLASVGVDYRKPYNTRHTCLSHAVAQGMPVTDVAYIAGHVDSTMVVRHYAASVSRPSLPKMLSP